MHAFMASLAFYINEIDALPFWDFKDQLH